MRAIFIGIVILLGLRMFLWLNQTITSGNAMSSLGLILIASPVMILAAWGLLQRGEPDYVRLTGLSAAGVIGDIFVLTTAAFLLAKAWAKAAPMISEFWTSPTWLSISFLIGLIGGSLMHLQGGKSDSNSAILSERLHDSGTSWTHNLGVAPAIIAAIVSTLLPLLVYLLQLPLVIGVIALLAIWFALVQVDNFRAKLDSSDPWHFNPQVLDCEMDWEHWRPRR